MALEIPGHPKAPLIAAAALTTNQFQFVKLTADFTVNICSAVTDVPIGVLQDKPQAANVPADVVTHGVTKVKAGGTITAGDRIGTDASGNAVKKTEGTDTTNYVVGVALQSAVSGDIFSAYLHAATPHRAA